MAAFFNLSTPHFFAMFTASQLLDKINEHIDHLNFSRHPKGLYDPIEYVLSLGGKRIRPVLLLMAYNLYRDDVEKAYAAATAIEVYHNCTLLHDDLMDNADVRRGKATVHKKWNENTAILSGDAMLILSYHYLAETSIEHLKSVFDIYNQTVLEICEGQQMDMEFEKRSDVTVPEYLEMIRLKTAVLLAASLKIGAILGGATEQDAQYIYDFGIQIGLAFQLQDDWLDVYGDPAVFGKKIGGDICCNKKTFMLIKALENADKQQQNDMYHWISAVDFVEEDKIAFFTQMYNVLGVKTLAEHKMDELYVKGLQSLAKISVSDVKKDMLRQMAASLMNRKI